MTAKDRGEDLARCVRRVLGAQVVLALLGAAALLASPAGPWGALAALYGAVLGIAGTLITARSAARTGRSEGVSLLPAYVGLANKLLVIAGGMAVGGVFLRLQPLYMILGFMVLQAGYLACSSRRRRAPGRNGIYRNDGRR